MVSIFIKGKKEYVLTLVIGICWALSYSQVGINTTSPADGSILDVDSSEKGVLVPRVDISNLATIAPITGGSTESLLVYNTNTTTGEGFYYWDGSMWVMLSTGNNDDWRLDGNSGTTNGTDFIGTTDAQNLDIRTNNVIRHRFTQQGQLEFLNTGNSVFIGEGAGTNDDLSANNNTFVGTQAGQSNTTGNSNSFLGFSTGINNTTGRNNSFYGAFAGSSNTTGNFNAFFGDSAGNENTTGTSNSFFGAQAGFLNSTGAFNAFFGDSAGGLNLGSFNSFFGGRTGQNNSTGNENSFFGYDAGSFNISGSGNVFLGFEAGFNEVGSNRLYIENSNAASPLIYGEFDTDIARINGTLQVSDPTATGYQFPTTDGTANQVLQTDGSGNVTFATLTASNDWSITGNTGTDSSTNFIGTTDNVDLNFRTNNTRRMELTTSGGLNIDPDGTATAGDALDVNGDTIIGGGTGNFDNASENITIRGRSEEWIVSVENTASSTDADFTISNAVNISQADFRITPDGRVGIGENEDTPGDMLHVTNDQNATTAIRIDNTNDGTDVVHTALLLHDGGSLEAFFRHNNNTDVLELGNNDSGQEVHFYAGNLAMTIDTNEDVNVTNDLNVTGDMITLENDQAAATIIGIDNNDNSTNVTSTALNLYDNGSLEGFFRHNNNTDIVELGNNDVGEVHFYANNLAMTIDTNEDVNVLNDLDVTGQTEAASFKLSALNTAPASDSDTGTTGEIRIVNGFIYVCVDTNTWQRAALSSGF